MSGRSGSFNVAPPLAAQSASPEEAKFDEYLVTCEPSTNAANMAVQLCRCEKIYGNAHKWLLLRFTTDRPSFQDVLAMQIVHRVVFRLQPVSQFSHIRRL